MVLGNRVWAWRPAAIAVAVLSLAGCASAYRQGVSAGKRGDWDVAVARLMKANEEHPDNLKTRIALGNARVEASQQHYKEAKKRLAAQELDKAAEELLIASRFDPGNLSAAEDLRLVSDKIRERDEQKHRLSEFDELRRRTQAQRVPAPVLSPRSPVPITMKFDDQPLEKIFQALGKLAGVNVVFDEGYRDKRVSFSVVGVTFEEALDQLTFVNRLFYKVVDQNTIIIVTESTAKRRQYDDTFVQTFYLQNADANETGALITKLAGIQKVAQNQNLSAITIIATLDKLALAQKIIEANDKARGEVMVEVQILEIDRSAVKKYGLELSQYEGSVTFSPSGASGEVGGGFTTARAHLLSSLNLADFIVSLPSSLTARLIQTDSSVRVLAAPKLRAAEGKKTTLKIGTDVPIPVTTFTATQAGTSSFAPATSFNYKTVGVTLDVTPKVSASGEISLELAIELSQIGEDRNVGTGQNPLIVPTFFTRTVNGVLRVKDGETSLIGGLLQTRDTDTLTGVFGIQSIPILNRILGSTKKQSDQQEILISLTPHIVRAPKVTADDLRSLNVGSEDLTRVQSARSPLFGSAEDVPPSPQAATAAPAPIAPPPAPAVAPPATLVPATSPAPAPSPTVAPAGPPAAGAAVVSGLMRPGQLSLRAGENGAIDLVVIGAKDVLSVEAVLLFDASLLEAVEAVPGPLLTMGESSVNAERSLEAGRARVRFLRPAPTSGAGAVASFKFKALKPGVATVSVQTLTLGMAGGSRTVAVAPARITIEVP